MNIRQITNIDVDYYEINREERNYAAILFAALCIPGNAEKFLSTFGLGNPVPAQFGVYFEYAFLRDLWEKIEGQQAKKAVLLQLLPIQGIDQLLQLPVEDINRKFGVAPAPSGDFLQSPGTWSLRKFSPNFPDRDDFLTICRFKWSFKIKPDIVIHLDRNKAVCIEAKYTSGEGSYPSKEAEKAIFKDRGIPYVGQTELQSYMMQDLLGIRTQFLILAPHRIPSPTHQAITWKDAFAALDLGEFPAFARGMASRIST
jgi:hypothetical protein